MDTALAAEPSPSPASILLILVSTVLLGNNLVKIAAFSRVSGVDAAGDASTGEANSLAAPLSINRLPASTAVVIPTSNAFLPNSFAASLPMLRAVAAARLATPDVKSRLNTPVTVSNIPAPPITYFLVYLLLGTTSIFIIVT